MTHTEIFKEILRIVARPEPELAEWVDPKTNKLQQIAALARRALKKGKK